MKAISTFLFLLFITATIFADFGQQWAVRYNGTGNSLDWANAVVSDNAGNVYVTGYATSMATSKDLFTIKYNSDGVPLWNASYNGPVNGGDYSFAIALDQQGNVYITGRSDRGANSSDYTTIKYNNNGNQLWVALYDGPSHNVDEAKAICVDANGNVYVTGKSFSTASANDIVTVKYNSSGVQQWVSSFNGTANGEDRGNVITVDNSGNVYVCGETLGAGFDFVTLRINADGTMGWSRIYNGPASGGDEAVGMALNKISGELYVTGYSFGGGATNYDFATIKYDLNGNQVWLRRFNGTAGDADIATAMTLDNSGNIFVTGTSVGDNSAIDSNFATIMYSPAGNIAWSVYYSGPGQRSDVSRSITTDNAGNVYISGSSTLDGVSTDYVTIKYHSDGAQVWLGTYNGPDNRDDYTSSIAFDNSTGSLFVTGRSFSLAGNYDYATIKYTNLVGLNHTGSSVPKSYNLYQNYPNPFNPATRIKFDIPEAESVQLVVFNMIGETIFNENFGKLTPGQYEYTFNAAKLSSGVYFYRIISGNFENTKKMVLVK